ncbi:MAG: hypothetical protein ACT4NY_17460 [Pseudonocardiales bacterium]
MHDPHVLMHTLRHTLLEIYVPAMDPQWEQFLNSGPVYARIHADRMFTFQLAPDDDMS